MATALQLDPRDTELAALHERVRRLEKINAALIDRVERSSDLQGSAFSMFETAISLEAMVRSRTAELEEALAGLASAHHDADAARARLRDAIESLSDGFALFDADDRLVMYNRAYLSFWPQIADIEESAPTFERMIEGVARSRRTIGALVSPERWQADRMALHAKAEGAHVQALDDGRWVQINELRTSEGGTVGIYTDITEVKAEDARERARELGEKSTILQSTLDTIRLGVAVYDAERNLTAWNGQLLPTIGLGDDGLARIMTHDGMLATCVEVNGPLGPDRPLDWLPAGSAEIVALRRQANGRVVEVRRASMPGGGMVMAFEDVTERLQAAQMLERRVAERTTELETEVAERRAVEAQLIAARNAAEHANRSKTSFIAAASHDLLQPLNAARLFVAALGERRLALPTRALVRQTGVALDSVEDLLEALFEISRLDAGAIQPEIADLDLDRMLAALRIEFAPLARSQGLALDIAETGLWVRSDVRLLRRILQNFVSNALRYTREGRVSLAASAERSRVRIEVCDTGPGIPANQVETIFEEFRRLDATAKVAGKGLGLAVVRRASAMLGHPVEVASEVGIGSTFAIVVDAGQPQHVEVASERRQSRQARAGEARVLIVDNDEAILSGMRALLTNWGFRAIAAPSADDPGAQEAIRQGVDAVIADYHLDGDERGDEAVAALRALAGAPLPAMIITADRSEEVKARLAAAKLPVLAKPVKPAQLRALLRTLLVD